MPFFTIIAYQSSPCTYPKETDFLWNAQENVIICARQRPLRYRLEDTNPQIFLSATNVIKYILQFHQGVKQGKGIRVNPLNLVPAQVTERNRD